MPEALAHDLPKTMDTIRNSRSWDLHGNGARVPAPWPATEFRILETRQTSKSLVPATFLQLPPQQNMADGTMGKEHLCDS